MYHMVKMEESLSRTSSGILVSSQSRGGSVRTGTTGIKSKTLNFKTLITWFWILWKKTLPVLSRFLGMPDLARLALCRPDLASRALLANRASRPVQGLENPFPTSTEKTFKQCNLWRVCLKTGFLPGKFGLSLLESGSENCNQFLKILFRSQYFTYKWLLWPITGETILNTTVAKLTSRMDICFCRFM